MEISLADWQESIVFCPSRFALVYGGRRLGKTLLAEARIKIRGITRAGHRTMLLTPFNSQLEETIERLLGDDELREHVTKTKTRPFRMWFRNGSRFDAHCFQRPQSIRSKAADDLIADESQDIPERAFWSVARPLQSDRRGSMLMLGQPRGADWRARAFYYPGIATPGSNDNPIVNGQPLYRAWKIPTSMGPAFQTEDGRAELEIARRQMSSFQYAVEYECSLEASPEATFKPVDLAAITKGAFRSTPEQYAKFVVGWDIGRVRDPSAYVVQHAHTGEVVDAARLPLNTPHDNAAAQCAGLQRRWNDALVMLDATGGGGGSQHRSEEIVKLYREKCKNVRAFHLNQFTKEEIMLRLVLETERRTYSIPAEAKDLLSEMQENEAHYEQGRWRFYGPAGHRDDLVIALALATWGRTHFVAGQTGSDLKWASMV